MIRFLFKSKIFGASKTTPVDADSVLLVDSADGSIIKKTTWALVKEVLTTFFNTKYVAKTAVPVIIQLACSDETTALTTGTGKMTFRMPHAMTLTEVRASLNVAGTTSGITTVDINEGGVSILSTKLTIDLTEKTSVTSATPAVISDTTLADDAEITIDIDAISGGATEKGLKITLIGNRSI